MRTKKISTGSFIATARKQQILKATMAVIAEFGYNSASLSEIAERVGVAKGVISYYFGSKGGLIRQVLISVFSEGAIFIQPRVEAEHTATKKLAAFIRANLEYIQSRPTEMAATLDILMNAGAKVLGPLVRPGVIDPRIAGIQQILEAGQRAKEFRKFNSRFIAIAISQAIDGVHVQLKRDTNFSIVAYTEELIVIFEKATAESK